MPRRLALFTIVLATALLPPAASGAETSSRGAEESAESLVRRLAERYAALETLQARFVQTHRSAAIGAEIEESGRIWVKRPRLRWDHETPDRKVFLVEPDGTTLTYVPDDASAVRAPLPDRAPHLELLLGRSGVVEDFAVAEVELEEPHDPSSRQVRLVPRRPLAGVEVAYLEIAPEGPSLGRVLVVDELGNVTDLVLENLRENRPVRDRVFDSRLPRGVEVRDATGGGEEATWRP